MRIEYDVKLDFRDVLIRPKRSVLKTRAEVLLEREFQFKHTQTTWQGVPIIASNMDHTGTLEMAKVLAEHHLLTALDKFIPLEDWQRFTKQHPHTQTHCFISLGIADADFAKLDEMFEELILSGADIVKIGIGPGSVCTTREKTGVGYPQLSAIIECADAAHGLGGQVCADGGCATPGDVAKAFAAGADFVMLGGMLAGHDECLGDVIEENHKKFKRFYGMSSSESMEHHHGLVPDYRSSEGRSVNVPYRGAVKDSVLDIFGGLRSTCTYVGAHRLKELSKRTTFIRVTNQINDVFVPFDVDKK